MPAVVRNISRTVDRLVPRAVDRSQEGSHPDLVFGANLRSSIPEDFEYLRAAGGQYFQNASGLLEQETGVDVPVINYRQGIPQGPALAPVMWNLVQNSSDMNDSDWVKTDWVVIDSAATGPDGLNTATEIAPNAVSAAKLYYATTNVITVLGDPHTYTFYIEPNGLDFVQILASTAINGGDRANFQFSANGGAGQWSTGNGTFVVHPPELLADGRYRLSVTEPSKATGAVGMWYIGAVGSLTAARAEAFVGDSVAGYIVSKPQMTASAFPTPYFETTAGAAGSPATILQRPLTGLGAELAQAQSFSLDVDMVMGHGRGSHNGAPSILSFNNGAVTNTLSFYLDGTNGKIGLAKDIAGQTAVFSDTLSEETWALGDIVSFRAQQTPAGVYWQINNEAVKLETAGIFQDDFSPALNTITFGNGGNQIGSVQSPVTPVQCDLYSEVISNFFLA